jgi:hypothetical protein
MKIITKEDKKFVRLEQCKYGQVIRAKGSSDLLLFLSDLDESGYKVAKLGTGIVIRVFGATEVEVVKGTFHEE